MLSIVLSRRDIREYDQIISLYTLEYGKVEAMARGVKKILSKNAALLEPFCFVEAEVIPGKEIAHIGSVQAQNVFKNIRADLDKSLMAKYAVELLDKIIHPGEPDKKIFALLVSWLEHSDKTEISNLVLLDAFVCKLLFLLGFNIAQSEKTDREIKKDLEFLTHGAWAQIDNLKLEKGEYERLHAFVYEFLLYHTERKLGDWAKLIF